MIIVAALFLVALVMSALIYPVAIGRLARARMGQLIREEGPAAHQVKAGTPTAGGLVFLLVALVLYLIGDRSAAGAFVLLALFAGGALGFLDDYAKFSGGHNLGLRARQKIAIQLASGALLGLLAMFFESGLELVGCRGLHHLRERFENPLLGIQNVSQFVYE